MGGGGLLCAVFYGVNFQCLRIFCFVVPHNRYTLLLENISFYFVPQQVFELATFLSKTCQQTLSPSFFLFSFILRLVPAVGSLRPAGRMWPSQPFYAACHMIWELASARRANIFFTAEKIV
jgi:hypothetical protein